jgi:acetyl esterase/lipase|tara:strand:- start:4914 stop:5825 length:912 start_codon:yes stop_codon:yes gene_type:complete
MKKILTILICFYSIALLGQKLDYANEFTYDMNRNLDYAGNGNIRQALDIYIPHNRVSEKLPVVVYIHGGGWARQSKDFAGHVMPFIRTGRYIGVAINYRLVDEATILEMVYDCKAAIRYLKANAKKYGIDKNKIGVWGHSAGGHLAAMIGLTSASKALEGDVGYYKKENGSVACAVDADGPTDFESLKSVEEEYKNSPLFKSFFNNDMEAVKLASPITHADGSCIPFFIYHGVKDKAVSVKQSEELYDKLTKKGAKEIYFLKITDGGHVFSDERITQQMLNFFDRYLHDDKSVVVDDSEFSLN